MGEREREREREKTRAIVYIIHFRYRGSVRSISLGSTLLEVYHGIFLFGPGGLGSLLLMDRSELLTTT
jgi:hypothetical protein